MEWKCLIKKNGDNNNNSCSHDLICDFDLNCRNVKQFPCSNGINRSYCVWWVPWVQSGVYLFLMIMMMKHACSTISKHIYFRKTPSNSNLRIVPSKRYAQSSLEKMESRNKKTIKNHFPLKKRIPALISERVRILFDGVLNRLLLLDWRADGVYGS